MRAAIPLSESLRERTGSVRSASGPSASERFMSDLLTGRGSRDAYVGLVTQNFFVYGALERAADARSGDPVAASFMSPALTRLPAIEEDLGFLLGDDWRGQITPLATTLRYVDRIERAAATSSGAFIAHHYTRYLGDLSGCSVVRSLMQRQFGFETNGVGFFLYAGIAKPKEFKSTYRAQLDAVGWTDDERESVVDEVRAAYRLTEELFEELASRHRSAA